ncbi:MAG TPA: acyl-CoA dehydrogenase family protein, partial [bacterium]|nr:acyl-CoA dehydrogenase family protein [bacterium]
IETDTARILTYNAAWQLQNNLRDADSAISIAKLFSSETSVKSTNRALQIFGSYGYIKDNSAERLYRDAKYTEISDGPSEVQRMLIADSMIEQM